MGCRKGCTILSMNHVVLIVIGVLGVISIMLFIIDRKHKSKVNHTGRYELKIGYSSYWSVLLQLFFVSILVIGAIDAIRSRTEMEFFFIPMSIFIFLLVIYQGLEIINHKITYNQESIVKINFLRMKTEIKFQDLESVDYSIFGYGRNLVFKDINGQKIKVFWSLNGFQTLVEYLKKQDLI